MQSRSLILICTLAFLLPARAQDPIVWHCDLAPAMQEAAATGRPILLLFTVERLCKTCVRLEEDVFGSPAYLTETAGRFVHVKAAYSGPEGCQRARQILAATARLRGYPTVYLLDADGWPCFVRNGYKDESAADYVTALVAGAKSLGRPKELRAQGEKGWRELLGWYRQEKMPFGETLAAAALLPHATPAEQAAWAPIVVGADVARDGAAAAAPHLEHAAAQDGDGAQGFLTATLATASDVLLRGGEHAEAGRLLERLVRLPKAAIEARMEAETSLGWCYRKLDAPCVAREHYLSGAALATGLEGDRAESHRRHAEAQASKLPACPPSGCPCASKRLVP